MAGYGLDTSALIRVRDTVEELPGVRAEAARPCHLLQEKLVLYHDLQHHAGMVLICKVKRESNLNQ